MKMLFRGTIAIMRCVSCVLFSGIFFLPIAHAGTLSCSVTTAAACTDTVILRMSGSSNAHAELPSQSDANYASNVICCGGVAGLGTACSGTFATAVTLSAVTNAHIEQNTESNYANDACMSVPAGGSVSVAYQASNCTGYDTTLASMSGTTNAHAGNGSAYATKICGTAAGVSQSLTFSLSDNTVGFGALSASAARYATGDAAGSGSDAADAHTMSASTNASSGYSITIDGSTLTCSACGGATVTAIGGTAVASSVGNEQFGARLAVNSGNGSAASPYNGSNWALDTISFPDAIASGGGDGATTEFGARYIANIGAATDAGSYSAIVTYIATATF